RRLRLAAQVLGLVAREGRERLAVGHDVRRADRLAQPLQQRGRDPAVARLPLRSGAAHLGPSAGGSGGGSSSPASPQSPSPQSPASPQSPSPPAPSLGCSGAGSTT